MAKTLTAQDKLRISFEHPELSIELAEKFACPECDGFIPNNQHIGQYPGAISRRDNKTEICSPCGNREALDHYYGSQKGVAGV